MMKSKKGWGEIFSNKIMWPKLPKYKKAKVNKNLDFIKGS